MDYLATHTSLSPIRRGFALGFVNYKKGCTRLAVASDKVYQLLAHGRWFSPGTPASSTTKTGRHDITEILLKVALKLQKSNQPIVLHFVQVSEVFITYNCIRDVMVRLLVFVASPLSMQHLEKRTKTGWLRNRDNLSERNYISTCGLFQLASN